MISTIIVTVKIRTKDAVISPGLAIVTWSPPKQLGLFHHTLYNQLCFCCKTALYLLGVITTLTLLTSLATLPYSEYITPSKSTMESYKVYSYWLYIILSHQTSQTINAPLVHFNWMICCSLLNQLRIHYHILMLLSGSI